VEYVEVEMSEPIQMNNETSAIKTIPLTPSLDQMSRSRVTFNTAGDNYITGGFNKSNAIPAPLFTFVNEDTNVTYTGTVKSVDPEDFKFQVYPDHALTPGEWTIRIRAISDDHGNTSSTVSQSFEIEGRADRGVYVVWADAHDNIYGYRNHEYQISDVIHIQFSKVMSGDVRYTSAYILNNNDLPSGTSVSTEDKYYKDGSGGNAVLGTMVTILLPHDQFGESHEWFDDTGDPYEPIHNQVLIIDPNVTDETGSGLQSNPLTGTTRYTLSYNTVNTVAPVTAEEADANHFNQYHVHAYVNKDSYSSSYSRFASLSKALASIYVSHITPIAPYYNNAGIEIDRFNSSSPDGPITVNYTGIGHFVFSAPVDASGVTIPLDNGVRITANTVDSITIDKNVEVDSISINSTSATNIYVSGEIKGTAAINAPNATITVIDAKETTTAGKVGVNALWITAMYALNVDGSATIHNFTLNSPGTVENVGEIKAMTIQISGTPPASTKYTVTLKGNAASYPKVVIPNYVTDNNTVVSIQTDEPAKVATGTSLP
jgi:hypothetical protein